MSTIRPNPDMELWIRASHSYTNIPNCYDQCDKDNCTVVATSKPSPAKCCWGKQQDDHWSTCPGCKECSCLDLCPDYCKTCKEDSDGKHQGDKSDNSTSAPLNKYGWCDEHCSHDNWCGSGPYFEKEGGVDCSGCKPSADRYDENICKK